MNFYRLLVITQCTYYLLTGLWPLLHLPGFMQVTGYKHDQWLVHQVALLALTIGFALAAAARTNRYDLPIVITATFTSLSFMSIDVVYSFRGIISPVYLVDALFECVFLFAHVWRMIGLSCHLKA